MDHGCPFSSLADFTPAFESNLVETLLNDEHWRSPDLAVPLYDPMALKVEPLTAGQDTYLAAGACKQEAGAPRDPSDRRVPGQDVVQPVKVKDEFEFNVFDLDNPLFGGPELGMDFGADLFPQPCSLDGVVPTMEPADSSSSSSELGLGAARESLSASSELASFAYRPTAAHTSVFMPTGLAGPQDALLARSGSVSMAALQRAEAWTGTAEVALGADAPLDRQARVMRYREKRKRRTFEKTIRYQSRKAYAEVRPRIKGRFATKEEVAAMKAAAVAGLPAPVFA